MVSHPFTFMIEILKSSLETLETWFRLVQQVVFTKEWLDEVCQLVRFTTRWLDGRWLFPNTYLCLLRWFNFFREGSSDLLHRKHKPGCWHSGTRGVGVGLGCRGVEDFPDLPIPIPHLPWHHSPLDFLSDCLFCFFHPDGFLSHHLPSDIIIWNLSILSGISFFLSHSAGSPWLV